jgi:hypothetical protein
MALRRTSVRVEPLEPRRLLATVVLNGTANADTILIERVSTSIRVTINGSATNVNALDFLTVNGGGGNDSITVQSIGDGNVEVFGDGGNDTIRVGGGDLDNNIGNFLLIDGGTGTDLVILDDTSDTGADSYTLGVNSFAGRGTNIRKSSSTSLTVFVEENVETLRLIANGSSNVANLTFNVNMGFTRFEMQGNGGDDTLNVSNALPGLAIDFNGGTGIDTFDYAAASFFVQQDASLLANSLSINSVATASWSALENLDLQLTNGSTAGTTWNILGVAAGNSVTVRATGATDAFTIGNGDIDANILGALTISGSTANPSFSDTILLSDANGTTADSYSLSADSFTKTGLVSPISFVGRYGFTLNANGGNNTVNVIDASASTSIRSLSINAAGGNDTVFLPNLARNTTIAGGTGTDTINLSDTLTSAAADPLRDYIVGITSVFSADVPASIVYTAFENVTFNAGPQSGSFTINNTSGGTSLVINAGAGDDALIFRDSVITAAVTFNGSTGIDSVDIEDNTTTTGLTYGIGGSSYTRSASINSLSFSSIEGSIGLRANEQANAIFVSGFASGQRLVVEGRGGNDMITVGAGDIDSNCQDTMTLLGGAGDDLLVFDDSTDSGDDQYRFVGNTFEKAVLTTFSGDIATFTDIETVELRANPGSNAISATTIAGTGRLRLIGNDGADTVTLTPSASVVLDVQGNNPTTVPGDVLAIVNGEVGGAASLLLLSGSGQYTFAAAQSISYSGIESFSPIPAQPSVPDLLASSDSGISSSDNLTNLADVIVSGTTAANAIVRVTRDGAVLATATASPAGVWAAPVSLVPGVNVLRAAGFDPASGLVGAATAALTVTLDQSPPTFIPAQSAFQFETAQSAVLAFSEPIGAAPAAVTGPGGSLAGGFTTSVAGTTVTLGFSPILADGNYVVDLRAATDAAGNAVGPSASLAFFVLAGDATRNQAVNGADLAILQANYGQAGRTFSQGNFSYDPAGDVDIDDLVLLTKNFAPGPTALYEPGAVATPRATPVNTPIRLALPGLPTGLDLGDFELLRFGVPQSLATASLTQIRPAAVELNGLTGPTALPGLYTLRLKTTGWTFNAGQQLAAPADLAFFHYKVGDMNCDGVVNNQDIAPFVLGLTNPSDFQQQFGYAPALPGDVTGDGTFNNQDIAAFVALLTGARAVPTPLPPVTKKTPRLVPSWFSDRPLRAVLEPARDSDSGAATAPVHAVGLSPALARRA